MAPKSSQKMHEKARRQWDHTREYWRPVNDLYGRLLSFSLDLEHYRTLGEGAMESDRRRVRPRTQRQLNLIRHKASLLLRALPEFDGHAVQPGASARAAEISRRVIENVFHDPLRGYQDTRERFVWSALAGGRGVIACEWHPRHGIVLEFRDPRRFHICPGHNYLHSPMNPYCIEEVPMRESEVQRMRGVWNVPSDLNPDDWRPDYNEGGIQDSHFANLQGQDSSRRYGSEPGYEGDRIITVLKTWYREDPFNPDRRLRNADLPEQEWHFVDDATGERIPFDPMNPEPPLSQATGQPMRMVTNEAEMYDPSGSEDKGYLCISAPFYKGKNTLFEGSWTEGALNPRATLSCFPYAEMNCYTHPLRRQGLSDTEATKSLVVVDNASFRATFEQMRQTGGVLITQAGGLLDSEGNQFQFSDDPVSIAYAKDTMAANSTNFFQAPGMNPAMPAFRNMVEQNWVHIGTGDIALGPERSRDIAVGTVNALQQSGDLPVQLHQQKLNLAEGLLARAALDLCSAYMGDNVVSWVTDEGEAAYATVRGEDLVPLKVTVTAGKEFRQQDVDRVQAQAQFLGMVSKMGLPPQAILVLLREAQFSPSVVIALAEALAGPQGTPQGGPPQPGGPPDLSVVQGGAQ